MGVGVVEVDETLVGQPSAETEGSMLQIIILICLLITEAAFAQQVPNPTPDVRTGFYRGQLVTYEVIDGLAIWDGDIIIGTEQELLSGPPSSTAKPPYRRDLSSVAQQERLWPGGVIPYAIDPGLENPNIQIAIKHWEENTLIRFIERTNQENWVYFTPVERGNYICASGLGMVGGKQEILFRKSCGVGTIIHEIGHTVGLSHEHQRNDRDCCLWMRPHATPAFAYEKVGPGVVDSGPYDYGSVMHYSWHGPIKTIPPGIRMGDGGQHVRGIKSGGRGLSPADIDGVSRLYGVIPSETTITTNLAGLEIEVDGVIYKAPHSFDWSPGSIHTITVPSPQKHPGYENFIGLDVDDYFRYLFANWSDGGAQSHTVAASPANTVFIANFIVQYKPTVAAHPVDSGIVHLEPRSLDGFYTGYSFVTATAKPADGFSFERWGRPERENALHSLNPVRESPFIVFLYGNAMFTQLPLTTIETTAQATSTPLFNHIVMVDGRQAQLPTSFSWEPGSKHVLDGQFFTPPDIIFNRWSDGGDTRHEITVPEQPSTITAIFDKTHYLKIEKPIGRGSVTVSLESPNGYHEDSSTVQLTAVPSRDYEFVSWLDDLQGSQNPQSLLMDSFKRVTAVFGHSVKDGPPRLVDGETHYLNFGQGQYWVFVPPKATRLEIHLVNYRLNSPVALYVSRGRWPPTINSQYSSETQDRAQSIVITPDSSPPLQEGLYFINVRGSEFPLLGKITASVTVPDAKIEANVPHFDYPVSLIVTRVGEGAGTQILEVRNSGKGTLNYRLSTDQPWLSVYPNQGSVMDETDTLEIHANPGGMEVGAFEGFITISEQESISGSAPAASVKVPVTLVFLPREEPITPPHPTGPAATLPGKPPAPTVSTSTPYSLTVEWAEPENTGTAITDYDVQYREVGSGSFTDAQHEGTGLRAALTGLSPDTVYEVQVRATNATGTGAWSESGEGRTSPLQTGDRTYYFPHLAVGASWQTTITYINYSAEEVSCRTDFLSDQGSPLMVSFADRGTVVSRTDVLPPGGSVHQETDVELSAPLAPGWALANCSGPVQASLLFRQHSSEGVPIAEGGVNAATVPATRFVTFAEQGEGKNGTGVAYANPSDTAALVTFTARDADGEVLAIEDLMLPPNGHDAQNMPTLFDLSSFTGSIEVTSTEPIVSLSLNFEADPVFSSLPPGELDASAQGSTTYYFPHLAVGASWQTTITYINFSSQEVTCQTDFLSDQGTPLMVSFAGLGTVDSRTDVLPPGGSVHQETDVALSAPLAPGWARATCSGSVKASLLYRLHNSEGAPTAEAGVNAAAVPATRFVTFAEQGEGQFGTGVAYANPSATSAHVTFTARDTAGEVLASVDRTLLPEGHDAHGMAELFDLTSFTGSIEVTSTEPIVSLSLNFEADPVFSSLPPGELDASVQ